GGADHGKPRLLEHARDVEGDEEFVLDHQYPCRCHCSPPRNGRRSQPSLVHLIYLVRSSPSTRAPPRAEPRQRRARSFSTCGADAPQTRASVLLTKLPPKGAFNERSQLP